MLNIYFKSFVICFVFVINQVFASSGLMNLTKTQPFTPSEIVLIQQHFFGNIATANHTFKKNENGKEIQSLPGAIIASPSLQGEKFCLDYQYHWVRDSAIVMREIIYLYRNANQTERANLKPYLLNYIAFETVTQQQTSDLGELSLGEPKYHIDGTVWQGPWSRPQNDGPALRANTLTDIAMLFLNEDPNYVKNTLLPLILVNLDYIQKNWQRFNYDLWEELGDNDLFFTKIVERKALIKAAQLFNKLNNDQAKKYLATADEITISLLQHLSDNHVYTETIKQRNYKGGGLNSSVLLGLIYGNTHDANDLFAYDDERVIHTIAALRKEFSGIYKINKHNTHFIGRYRTDVFDGNHFENGNPWNLTSSALAEYYYSLATIYLNRGYVYVSKLNQPFFAKLSAQIKVGKFHRNKEGKQFYAIVNGLIARGDQILTRIKRFSECYDTNNCYHLAEQIDRNTGKQVSAKDLTWSYYTLLSALNTRPKA